MLDQLRKDVIQKTLDAHVAKFFDTNAAAVGLSKRWLAVASLWRLSQLLRGVIRILQYMREYSVAWAPSKPMDTERTVEDDSESLPSRSNSRNERILRRKSSKCHWTHLHSRFRSKDVNIHSS